jgi:hypothetical protein
MNTYLNTTAASAPPATGGLWMMQGIWQESAETVAIGELHGSTLLEDESRSQLNAIITANVAKGVYPHANLVLVNNVCDGGAALNAALQNTFPKPSLMKME